VLVVPVDIPLVTPAALDQLIAEAGSLPGISLAPSRDGGTNALLVQPPLAIPFRFGPDSLGLHRSAARQRHLPIRIIQGGGMELDIDTCDDLLVLADRSGGTTSQRLVREWDLAERMACA